MWEPLRREARLSLDTQLDPGLPALYRGAERRCTQQRRTQQGNRVSVKINCRRAGTKPLNFFNGIMSDSNEHLSARSQLRE